MSSDGKIPEIPAGLHRGFPVIPSVEDDQVSSHLTADYLREMRKAEEKRIQEEYNNIWERAYDDSVKRVFRYFEREIPPKLVLAVERGETCWEARVTREQLFGVPEGLTLTRESVAGDILEIFVQEVVPEIQNRGFSVKAKTRRTKGYVSLCISW